MGSRNNTIILKYIENIEKCITLSSLWL